MYTGRSCWLCGRNGTAEPLDKHHIFGGACRKKSEKYGLTVYLCHGSCHIFGEKAVHSCRETMDELHRYAGTRMTIRGDSGIYLTGDVYVNGTLLQVSSS